jgi:Tetracyclin repressor-like, C-terminal domain
VFENTIRDGIKAGHFRQGLDSRLTMPAILGMANAVPAWHRKENLSLERIAADFIEFVMGGIAAVRGPSSRPSNARLRF